MIRTAGGRLADPAPTVTVSAPSRLRVLLAGDLAGGRAARPSLLERLAGRLLHSGDLVITTSSRPGRAWRNVDMFVTALANRSRVDVAVVQVKGRDGLKRAEVVTRVVSVGHVPVVHLLTGSDLADVAVEEPERMRRLLASGRASIALSGHLAEALVHFGGVTDVIADPVEAAAYRFRERRALSPKVLWVCGPGPMSEPGDAAQVLAELAGTRGDAAVTFVTRWDTPQLAAAALEAAERSEIGTGLRVTNPLGASDTAGLLAEHDIVVYAVDVDDSPIGIAEAMAAGLCVIAIDWGGAGYLLADGVDGLLVKPRDPSGVAAAIERLLADPDLAERLSRAAHVRAQTFDWSRALPRWRSALTKVAAAGGQ